MQLHNLTLTQVRAFEQAEFSFQPGMNLVVGINGVGKSTVLDALRVLLSQALPKFTASRSKPVPFSVDDIRVGRGALTAELRFEAAGINFTQLLHQPRDKYIPASENEGQVREQAYDLIEHNDLTPDEKALPKQIKARTEQPLAVYFSTRRSLLSRAAQSNQRSARGQAAFAEALTHRELRLREFADWWLAQEALAQESSGGHSHSLAVLSEAVAQFLDHCTNLRAVREPKVTLLVDKDGMTLDVEQLSDGERGVLALILDLTRRLTQANPKLPDPLQKGQAVVLIDELDLHLHPRWQRNITQKLTATFPACQFIATTHSPQIVGEVPPENIILLESGQPPLVPEQSLGMDSNWILRYLMGADERPTQTKQQLQQIADLIDAEQYDEATDQIDAVRAQLGEFPELVRLQTRIDRIRLLGR